MAWFTKEASMAETVRARAVEAEQGITDAQGDLKYAEDLRRTATRRQEFHTLMLTVHNELDDAIAKAENAVGDLKNKFSDVL